MSHNPVRALRRDLLNAYEVHDRVAFEQHLDRMERVLSYAGPPPAPPAIIPSDSSAAIDDGVTSG